MPPAGSRFPTVLTIGAPSGPATSNFRNNSTVPPAANGKRFSGQTSVCPFEPSAVNSRSNHSLAAQRPFSFKTDFLDSTTDGGHKRWRPTWAIETVFRSAGRPMGAAFPPFAPSHGAKHQAPHSEIGTAPHASNAFVRQRVSGAPRISPQPLPTAARPKSTVQTLKRSPTRLSFRRW